MCKTFLLLSCMLSVLACCQTVRAQRRYELVLSDTVLSVAERTAQRLTVVDDQGEVTVYRRDSRYDAVSGEYVAYVSDQTRQIVRWPAADHGRMQIAPLTGSSPEFRASRMVVRPVGVAPGDPGTIDIDPGLAYRFHAGDAGGRVLEADPDGRLSVGSEADRDAQIWQVTALTDGYFRLHAGREGRRWSLTAGPDGVPRLERTARDPRQLWQCVPLAGRPGFCAWTCFVGGPHPLALTLGPTGNVVLAPFTFASTQVWHFHPIVGPLPPIFAGYRFVSRELRPNPPLEPAQVEFVNDHRKELWVLVADRLNPERSLRLKIPAGASVTRELVRDAGGTLVEIYEFASPTGFVEREELVTPLPPLVRYDVSVYELALQSIAIDRTVPGGKVEDVNYSPKSIGWFELPPGAELPSGPLPVFETARSRRNPGAARKLEPSAWRPEQEPPDPVESLLEEFRRRAGKE